MENVIRSFEVLSLNEKAVDQDLTQVATINPVQEGLALRPKSERPRIMGKPVHWVNTGPLNEDSGFVHKKLCDGPTFTAGTACAYSCQFCYVEAMVMKQDQIRNILNESGLSFSGLVIRRKEVLRRMAQDLTVKEPKDEGQTADKLLTPELIRKWGLEGEWSLENRVPKFKGPEWKGKVIFGSPLVDIAATKELSIETVELCEMILRSTDLDIRLLSKSPLLADIVAKELDQRLPDAKTGAKARVIFGLSTGTIDDKVAAAIETHAPSPSARLKALHWLQDNGFRTYGMLCPILPQRDEAAYTQYAQTAMAAIRADRCEEIWAEVVNFRVGAKSADENPADQRHRDSFQATYQALVDGGFQDGAALFHKVATDSGAWEQYSRTLFEALVEAAPKQTIPSLIVGEKAKAKRPNKLWWLHYPRTFASIHDYWGKQEVNGAVLLGAVVTRLRNPKKRKKVNRRRKAVQPKAPVKVQ